MIFLGPTTSAPDARPPAFGQVCCRRHARSGALLLSLSLGMPAMPARGEPVRLVPNLTLHRATSSASRCQPRLSFAFEKYETARPLLHGATLIGAHQSFQCLSNFSDLVCLGDGVCHVPCLLAFNYAVWLSRGPVACWVSALEQRGPAQQFL